MRKIYITHEIFAKGSKAKVQCPTSSKNDIKNLHGPVKYCVLNFLRFLFALYIWCRCYSSSRARNFPQLTECLKRDLESRMEK